MPRRLSVLLGFFLLTALVLPSPKAFAAAFPDGTLANQVTWLASLLGSHTVRPDVRRQPVLVLETINTYSRYRLLRVLVVEVRGTAAESEFESWELYADDNGNGLIDDDESPLAVAAPLSGQVRFDGFSYRLDPNVQRRLLVAYSAAPGSARDGATVDAVIRDNKSFVYDTSTTTVADFELNSPGEDTFDGCVRRQIESLPVVSRTLGGRERDVLTLDLHLPSNGWQADELSALEIEIVAQPDAAVLGADIAAIHLWASSGASPAPGGFDVARDSLLATLLPGASRLQFTGLSLPIPAGGRRVYVTIDVSDAPTEGRVLEMRLPIDGLTVVSGNDGPIDQEVPGTATHRFSSSPLLSSVSSVLSQVSVGQQVDVRVVVQNRTPFPLPPVYLHRLEVVPPRPGSQISGPVPGSLTLEAGATDTMTCSFVFDLPGAVHFEALTGLMDSTLLAPLATSAPVLVQSAPTAVLLDPVSNVSGAVYTGQAGVVPLIWRLTHADADSLAAPLAIRQIGFVLEDALGVPRSARAVFDRFELRAGTRTLSIQDPAPDSSRIDIILDPPVILAPGEQRDVSLVATIATNVAATSFRVGLPDPSVVIAEDATSGAAVPLTATLPWFSPLVTIRTVATSMTFAFDRTLPPAINQGQTSVGVGRLNLSVPGSPGASEARLTQIVLEVHRPDGGAVDFGRVFRRFLVTSGTTVLYEATSIDTTGGRLDLPLTIPKTVTSGAQEMVDLSFDVEDSAPLDSLRIAIVGAADLHVVDAVSGLPIPAVPVPPDTFPVSFGAAVVQSPAGPAEVDAASRTPATAAVGTRDLPVADLQVDHRAAAGSARLDFASLAIRTVDTNGMPLVPGAALDAVRLWHDGIVVASSTAPPMSGSTVLLQPISPLSIAPGDSLLLWVDADLAPGAPSEWLRFVIDAGAVTLCDANQPSRTVSPSGTIPFATELVRVIAPATQIALGVPADPPTNAPRDGRDVEALVVRLGHPGTTGQSPIEPRALSILVRDAQGMPIDALGALRGARLRAAGTVAEASLAADSLLFDLQGMPVLDPSASLDLVLALDIAGVPTVEDLRLALDTGSLRAVAGTTPLAVQAVSGFALPYMSPSIHLSSPSLEASLSNYPNPFAAGREQTAITFQLAADARVTVDVYALSGERVARLLDSQPLSAGLHDELRWDGRNGDGEVVRNGTYLLRLVVDGPAGGKFLRRLAVLR